ncbi:MAG: hypothetical protein LR008_00105 [Candidatus Pacebacteria bacterium]|nr:hypothetical protein [Candidatus Paceibacterota bacterium]
MITLVKTSKIFSLLVLAVMFVPFFTVSAGEYSVRPFLIDTSVVPRDVVQETVLLTNEAEFRKYVVYATVNEISVDNEGVIKEFVTPVMTDRTNTVTSWIQVTRGAIDIPPGEQKEVPLTIKIHKDAQPGEYHVFIGFVPGPNRPAAQAIAMKGEGDGVIVKITVEDQRSESMKISAFLVDRFVFRDDSRFIDVEVENRGDIASAPIGEIIFYNSRGAEVTSVSVNDEGLLVQPGEKITLTSQIPVADSIGRFKANVSLKYGGSQQASLFDTAFFYVMPLHLLLLVFGGILLLALFTTLMFKRTFIHDNYDDGAGDEVTMYVREGHDPKPQDHDIDLKNKTE